MGGWPVWRAAGRRAGRRAFGFPLQRPALSGRPSRDDVTLQSHLARLRAARREGGRGAARRRELPLATVAPGSGADQVGSSPSGALVTLPGGAGASSVPGLLPGGDRPRQHPHYSTDRDGVGRSAIRFRIRSGEPTASRYRS